jgi:hypothetical protein
VGGGERVYEPQLERRGPPRALVVVGGGGDGLQVSAEVKRGKTLTLLALNVHQNRNNFEIHSFNQFCVNFQVFFVRTNQMPRLPIFSPPLSCWSFHLLLPWRRCLCVLATRAAAAAAGWQFRLDRDESNVYFAKVSCTSARSVPAGAVSAAAAAAAGSTASAVSATSDAFAASAALCCVCLPLLLLLFLMLLLLYAASAASSAVCRINCFLMLLLLLLVLL